MFKSLRELFVGKQIAYRSTEPPKDQIVQTINVESPKLEVVPQTIQTKLDLEQSIKQFPKSSDQIPKRKTKPKQTNPNS